MAFYAYVEKVEKSCFLNFFGGEGANLGWGKCCHILRTDLVYLPPVCVLLVAA